MSATTHSGHTPVTNHSPTGGTTPAPFDGASEMCVIVLETDELYVFHKNDNEKILNESNYITSLFKQRQAALDAYSQSRDKYAHSLYDNHANNGAPHLTKNEEHVMDQKELALAQAHSHLLNVLLPSFKEDAASKVPGMSNKITEIIVARNIDQGGFKLTWVRSAVLKNHFRRYKLSSADLKTGQKSFITNNRIDTDKLKSQMKDLSIKAKLTIPWLDHWIGKQDVNKAMGNWKAAYNNRPSSSVDVSFSAQAQVLRAGIATEGAGFEYDRKKKQLSAKMDAKIDLTLAEGKVSMVINYPRNGLPLRLGSMDFGPLRASLTISASAGAGATLAFGLGVEVDAKKGTIKGISSTIDNLKSTRPGQVADLKGLPNSGANAEVNAFAGATAEASFAGALEWKTPEKNSIFKAFAMVKPGIAGTAGIGGELALKVTFSDGKFRVFCKAALCFGVGAKGSLAFEVDTTVLFQFMYWACCQLGRSYKTNTGIFSPSAMVAIYYISMKAVHTSFEHAAKNVYGKSKNWCDQVAHELHAEADRVDLMQKILKNTDFIKYTIPSVKGGMIHSLINSSYWARTYPENTGKLTDFRVGSMSTRKQAIILIFTWVQSQDEFNEIMANIRPTPESPKIPSATGFGMLKTFMAQGEIDAFKPKRSTTFENNIQKLYDRLKPHPQPGQPIIKNNMTEYLARSERAPHFPHGHPVDEAQLEETWLAMETTQQRDGGSA